jgi:hypothetical protein
MASADFWQSISAPRNADSTRQIARSPRVLRTHLHAYARRIYVTAFRTCIGLSILWPADPAVPPLSASCSSRQRFASGFLPTPGHPGNRCLPLTLAHVGCAEDFHLQVSAPCRAHRKTPLKSFDLRGVLFESLAVTYSSMATGHTTIGAERFHFRVRNGIGWFPLAIAARQTV